MPYLGRFGCVKQSPRRASTSRRIASGPASDVASELASNSRLDLRKLNRIKDLRKPKSRLPSTLYLRAHQGSLAARRIASLHAAERCTYQRSLSLSGYECWSLPQEMKSEPRAGQAMATNELRFRRRPLLQERGSLLQYSELHPKDGCSGSADLPWPLQNGTSPVPRTSRTTAHRIAPSGPQAPSDAPLAR